MNAIIIGASSGIGRGLAKVLAQNGYAIGLTVRGLELLQELQKEIKTKSYVYSSPPSFTFVHNLANSQWLLGICQKYKHLIFRSRVRLFILIGC